MFLFLSKLLPLFIYPLGFATLMLIGALLTLWKRPRTAAILVMLALLAIVIPSNGWVAKHMVKSLEWQNLPIANLPQAEAIVVLGGATKPQKYPRPWLDVSEEGDRILHAARLYLQKKAPLVIMSGGRIDWAGNNESESGDMAKLAEAMGVPPSAILQEPTSLNTYENAVNVKQILQQKGIKRVLLVTSAMHMPRSLAIFRKLGIEATPAPTDFIVSQEQLQDSQATPQDRVLNALPDTSALHQFTRSLKEYIGLVVYRLRGWL